MRAIKFVMKPTTTSGQPHLVQGLLQVDHDLAAIRKSERDHAARALIVDVGIGVVIQTVAADFYARQQTFGLVQKFKVGHYNQCMLKLLRILVMAHALVGGAAMLTACGQTGPLFLPDVPASAGRATLPQTLNPWHTQAPSGKPTPPMTAPAATPK